MRLVWELEVHFCPASEKWSCREQEHWSHELRQSGWCAYKREVL